MTTKIEDLNKNNTMLDLSKLSESVTSAILKVCNVRNRLFPTYFKNLVFCDGSYETISDNSVHFNDFTFVDIDTFKKIHFSKNELKTSKGNFVVVKDCDPYPFHYYVKKYGNTFYKLNDMSSKDATNILDLSDMLDVHTPSDYKSELLRLLRFKRIEIDNDSYIFKDEK